MPTSPYFPTYYSGHSGEQGLVQNLVDEQIKLFGTDIYYIPRIVLQDNTLDEVRYSKYQEQFQIEMILQNVMGFGDNAEFISKFGLRITDEIIFRVSTRRWDEEVAEHSPSLTVTSRPNEGDLLYFPLTQDIYEIKFVGKEEPFFQFGKIQFYAITAEIYEIGSDDFDTGVEEIDDIEQLFDPAIKLFMDPGGSGDFQVGEEIVGDEFLAKATATIDSGAVNSIVLTDGGSHYKSATPPSVTIGSPPAPGSVTNMQTSNDNGVFATDSGTGYLSGVTYNTTTMTNYGPGTGSGLTIRIDNLSSQGGVRGSGGQTMSNITIINSGSGYTKDLTGSGGSQGSLVRVDGGNDDLYLRVNYVSVTSPAAATANVSSTGIVNGITITDPGSGYTSAPTVTIDYSPKDNRAEVKSWDSATRALEVYNRTGTFTTAEIVTGLTSGATWSPETFDTLNNTNSNYDQNRQIEDSGDEIIDWTEGNPFGEFGNFTDSI
tara:strand:- start:3591 stop:5054 length:1464 start_codon:yes stop_codon:yes gene_type:complete